MAGWLTINQASCILTPRPGVSESDLAKGNNLKWPCAEWWINFGNYEEIFSVSLLSALLVFSLCSVLSLEQLVANLQVALISQQSSLKNVWKEEAKAACLSEPGDPPIKADKSRLVEPTCSLLRRLAELLPKLMRIVKQSLPLCSDSLSSSRRSNLALISP